MGIIVRNMNMNNFSHVRLGTNDYHEIIENTNFAALENGATIGNGIPNIRSVSSQYFGPSAYSLSMGTGGKWTAVGSIFNNNSIGTNTFTRSSKHGSSASTFRGRGSASSPFYIVIDLGVVRSFNHARYYQTFSDGKATHCALDLTDSDELVSYNSHDRWEEIHGFQLLDNSSTSTGIGVDFKPVRSRYVRIRLYNDARYGSGSYTELYNIKLFYVV